MRPALYLLLTLLSCWHVLSAGLDPGSGDGPTVDSSHSSSNGASSTARHPTEGSGGVMLTDDEDDVIPAAATTTTASSATAASTSRSLVTSVQASDNDEGSGADVAIHRCDPGTSDPSRCYCVDEADREIPGTRGRISCKPVEEETIVPVVASTYGRSVLPSLSSTTISTNEIDIDADTTSTVSESTSAATSTVPSTVSRTSTAAQTTVTTTTTLPTTAVPSTLATTTTTMPPPTTTSVPTRAAATHKVTVAAARHASSTVRHAHTQPTTTLSNEVPYVKDASNGDDEEEKTNEINAAAEPLNRGASHETSGGLHPGLLAAIIGGGVVGLLCAILLIMFIVYRMRKKDEGSYPLDDGKPRALYKSPPSKEFYA